MPFAYNPTTGHLDVIRRKPIATNYSGSDCSGESPEPDRTLTTSGVREVYLDGLRLQLTNQYTVSSDVITFLVNVRDSQKIIVVN